MPAAGNVERDAEFTAFMRGASASLSRTAWLLCGDAEQAGELVQAALVKTYLAWSRARSGDPLAYARRVLVNLNIDRFRRNRTVPTPTMEAVEASDPHGRVDDHDQASRMLAELPTQQRRVIVLRYYLDLPEAEVARTLGISLGSVKSAASRGLATLRSRFVLVGEGDSDERAR